MGLIAHHMRLQTLIQRKNIYELEIQHIDEELNGVIAECQEYQERGKGLDPDDENYKQIKAEIDYLNKVEERYNMKKKAIEAKLQAAEQEYQSCEQALAKNIQSSFGYTLGGQ